MASVLILGATSDVAMSVARKFASEKYNIFLAARNSERLKPMQSDLMIRYGVSCNLYEFDAMNFDNHSSFISSLPELPAITVCAFGYLGDEEAGRKELSETLKIIHSNYTGAVSILNSISSQYKLKREGCIIGISSVAGDRGRSSNYIYGSAKAGFTAYLSGLRNEMHHNNVSVISILPGFISSKMTAHLTLPGMLTSTPDEVASRIYSSFKNKKNIVYVKWYWRWIMLIIKLIPEGIFKKLKM
ncbi:MAG TPA: SDR family oxidoreductase [Ferruginibacter sp.]|nr:SDR family oxidoreductase [Ferruginibacter sp.]